MKLLSAFRDQIKAVGNVERVWFTSFVINIEFIETYLLPCILDMDTPKLRMDYEGMQQVLGERDIDVQVFCDKRFIEPDQNKRTAIPVHGVSPERLPANGALEFTENSLFHAKVIYIQGDQGAVLGSGSANLTVDGWGRNQEVFSFVTMAGPQMAKSVAQFFQSIFDNVDEPFPSDFPTPEQTTEQENIFCHSLAGPSFLDRLMGEHPDTLAVWSPYFSRDISQYVEGLQRYSDNPALKVQLVPDRVENQYLRSRWQEGLAELHERGLLAFMFPPVQRDNRSSMTHAKLWKTADRLAIGSWNFTQSGSNLVLEGASSGCNVEAGFIFHDSDAVTNYVGEELLFAESLFANQEQLEEERLRVPKSPPFDIQVIFDWRTERYRISGVWLGEGPPTHGYELKLPGIPNSVAMQWLGIPEQEGRRLQEQELPVSTTKELLAHHSYEVSFDGALVARGLIIEKRSVFRRAQQYEDLRGLLDALVLSGGEPPADDAAYRVHEDDDGRVLVDALSGDETEIHDAQEHDLTEISYFRLFSACHHYSELLSACRNQKELEYWSFIRPGCLNELVDKTEFRINATSSPSMFNWFLAQEVNRLGRQAAGVRNELRVESNGVPDERWQGLRVKLPKLPKSLSPEYREWLKNEYHRLRTHKEVE
ncbi:MAG: phospholipase D-like domain-containing protein [Marinobacter sp.]|nr:phospholipase D-like domain-containing protein [Marinobacter sp.]